MNTTLTKQWSGTCNGNLCTMSAVVITCGQANGKRSTDNVLTLTATITVPWNASASTVALQQQMSEDTIMDIVMGIESDVHNHLLDVGNMSAGGIRYNQWPDSVCGVGEVAAFENGVSYCRECSFIKVINNR